MLARHAGLAREMGTPADRVLTLTDGAQLTLDGTEFREAAGVAAPNHFVDGTLDAFDAEVTAERPALTTGCVHDTVAFDRAGRPAAPPAVTSRGWLDTAEHADVVDALATEIAEAVEDAARDRRGEPDIEAIERVVRLAAGRFVGTRSQRRFALSATVISLD